MKNLTKDELAEIRVILWRFYDFLSQGRWSQFAPYMFDEKERERVKELAKKVEKIEKGTSESIEDMGIQDEIEEEMTKQNQKTIEEKLEKYFGHYMFIWSKRGRKDFIKRIEFLLSDIIREIVGGNREEKFVPPDAEWHFTAGYNQAKQEIREKARKLGIKV